MKQRLIVIVFGLAVLSGVIALAWGLFQVLSGLKQEVAAPTFVGAGTVLIGL